MFETFLNGFSGPKKTVDPEPPSVFYSKRWYQSDKQTVTIACRTATMDGEFYDAHCDFVFLPGNSDTRVKVEKKENGVIRATIYDQAVATLMYKNLEMNPFFSNETVLRAGLNGTEEISRVYAECSPVVIMSPEAKSCVIEVIPD